MASHPPRNARTPAPGGAAKTRPSRDVGAGPAWTPHPGANRRGRRRGADEARGEWLWGWHAVTAALANPVRGPARRLIATADRALALKARFGPVVEAEIVDAASLGRTLSAGAVHQGIALRAALLEPVPIAALAEPASGLLIMLDQVTDPQNVGAIFRSAAAFGARGVILQERHAPPSQAPWPRRRPALIDALPHAREINLSRALDLLDSAGWRTVGLAGSATETLAEVLDEGSRGAPTVLVLGSEGEGLRRLVREHCQTLARIPMPGGVESLNVSAAAAVALYEAGARRR